MFYLWLLGLSIFLYLGFALFVFYFQKKMLFRPIPLEKNHVFEFNYPCKELWLGLNKNINALLFKVENPKGVVLYHHGNSRNIQHWGQFHQDFTTRGYDVLFYDYPAFGKSKGLLTQGSLYKSARVAYKYLLKHYQPADIIQFGRSLGSALATRSALRYHASLLILETPYLSMKRMAQHSLPFIPVSWLLRFPLRQDLDIKKVSCPILILSGTEDELTPHNHSKQLSLLNKQCQLVVVADGTHNGLTHFESYQNALTQYLGAKTLGMASERDFF
jgi:uncharacterized protein